MKIVTTALIAAALGAVATPAVYAQGHGDASGLLALVREEMAQLEQLYDAAFGDTDDVGVVGMEEAPAPLTPEEKTLACRVGVQRVAEQALLAQEAQRMRSRLRTSGLVAVHFVEETSCAELPTQQMTDECVRVASMDDDITAFLRDGKTAEEICDVVHELEAFEDDPTPLSCKLCKRFVDMVDQAIAQDVQQVEQVREVLGDLCDSMAADSMCHTFLNKFDDVVSWLKHGSSPDFVCAKLMMCTATATPQLPLKATETAVVLQEMELPDKNECMYCQHVTTVVGFVLRHAPSHIDFVRTLIDMGCQLVPSGVCAIAEKNFDQIVALTKQGKEPKEVCETVGMCAKALLLDAPTTKALELLTKPQLTVKLAELFLAASPSDDKQCFYCDYAATLIEVALQEDPTDLDQVRTYAEIVCGMLGETNVCHKYLDKLGYVVEALQKGKKPRAICAELKFCTATMATKALPGSGDATAMSVAMPAVHGLDNCFFCTQVATLFEVAMAQDPSEISRIRSIADLVCKALPKDNQCHKVMQQIDEVIDSIKKGEKPEAVCHDMGFCPATSTQASLALVVAASPLDDKKCLYCDYFTTLLEIALQEDPTDLEQIRQYADIICGILGETNVCHKYLDKIDYVMDALEKGKKPHEICTELKFCTAMALPQAENETSALLAHAMVKSVVKPTSRAMDNCFFCTQVASLMEVAYAQDPSQIDQIRMVADLICKALPKENKCHEVVKEFDAIVDSIKKGEKPAAICHDLKFCPTASFSLVLPKALAHVKTNNCAYCDGVTTVLEYAIKLKPDQLQQVREAAGIVCDFLPQDDQCHNDLKMFDKAVGELKAGKSPHEICTEFKFCNSTAALPASKLMPLSAAKLEKMMDAKTETKAMSVGCLMCEYTAEVLVHIAGDTRELHMAKQTLETMCFVLPPSARCDVLSSKFDNLVQLVGQGKSPSQACSAISLCDAVERKRFGSVIAVQ